MAVALPPVPLGLAAKPLELAHAVDRSGDREPAAVAGGQHGV